MESRESVKITEIDQDMIEMVIEKFVNARSGFVTAGFEMVMLHGSHGQAMLTQAR
jgi:2,4-dienoyl-CoA reductase-like NADH-dependent reductase (Old Yellow Enzyme family)